MPDVSSTRRVFVSYASPDRPRVVPIIEELRALGTSSWIDTREIRAGDRLTDTLFSNIEKCSSLVVMLSRASAERDWVKREVGHALSLIERGHDLSIIPCLLEACEPLTELRDHIYADFTHGYASGMRQLLAGIFRDREVLSCRIDPAHPLQLLETELREELATTLTAREGIPELLFYLDTVDLRAELKSLSNPYAGMLKSLPASSAETLELAFADSQDRAPLLLQNLGVALGAVAREVFSTWQRQPGLEKMLISTIQSTVWFVLYDFWKTVQNLTGRDFSQLRSVQGEALQHIFAELEAQPPGRAQSPFAEMAHFHCAFEQLMELELAGHRPVADGRLWVPASEIPADTREAMRHPILPIPPSAEFIDLIWIRSFVPGLARSHIWRCSRAGLRLADHADRFSVSKEDYDHVGPS